MSEPSLPELVAEASTTLDWCAVARYLRDHLPGLRGDLTVQRFANGAANLTFLVRIGETELVVRRPPFGAIAPGAHDMAREHKVLSRLWQVYDRAPRALLLCTDPSVLGADFLVVERRRGVVVLDVVPEELARHPDVGRRIGFAVVDAMADLHLVDPAACGLEDLGRPEGFVERTVRRWRERWELARRGDPTAVEHVGERLAESMPAMGPAAIIHNDLKPDNCQFHPRDPDHVRSVFDWDMATIGDPLLDLGTLLNYWPDPSDPGFVARAPRPGMVSMGLPTRAELVDHYATATGFDVSAMDWWQAFAGWKTAVAMQQLYNRWLDGDSDDGRMAGLPVAQAAHVEAAARLLDSLGA